MYYSVAARGGETHDSDAAVLVEVECEGEAITVEKTRKGRIPLALAVDGTGQIGPRLAAKMGEIARAGAKAGHARAEH